MRGVGPARSHQEYNVGIVKWDSRSWVGGYRDRWLPGMKGWNRFEEPAEMRYLIPHLLLLPSRGGRPMIRRNQAVAVD